LFLLDANHCFRLIARDERIVEKLNELGSVRVVTSVVVGAELRYGASISQQKRENLAAVQEFLSGIVQVTITPSVAQRYGTLKAGAR